MMPIPVEEVEVGGVYAGISGRRTVITVDSQNIVRYKQRGLKGWTKTRHGTMIQSNFAKWATRRIDTAAATPNPGSDSAIAQGCTCAVLDNGRGNERLGKERGFWITQGCPVHAKETA